MVAYISYVIFIKLLQIFLHNYTLCNGLATTERVYTTQIQRAARGPHVAEKQSQSGLAYGLATSAEKNSSTGSKCNTAKSSNIQPLMQ